ncbi:tetraacyldisaccharide 4'-kinase [Candidatus Poribacteria bacterium]|nr:tetraacyldisaccharide 4'-kinase [Candidatus Poribacteria bacterium]
MEYLYHVITGHHVGVLPALIRALLTPLSWIYGSLVIARGWLYERRILKPKRLPCAVISVGNITVGGTGKTPTVIWIAKYMRDAGFRVAILLRGYRRQKRSSPIAVVSDGKEILLSTAESGDEAQMIAKVTPGVPVLVGKDRYGAGLEAIRRWGVQVVILDDGFQYRQLARELDIVTVDGTQAFGTGRLLPAGTLREPISALRRADAILLTRMDVVKARGDKAPTTVRATIEKYVKAEQIGESCHQPTTLYRLGTGEKIGLSLLKGQRALAVCGIGNPGAFADTLRRYEPQHVELLAFPDHHRYTPSDLIVIRDRARLAGANMIVITQKDEQKLLAFSDELPILVLVIELVLTTGQESFKQQLKQAVEKTCH